MPDEISIRAVKTPKGWQFELDNAAWVQLMSALTIAANSEMRTGRPDEAVKIAALRSAFSRIERTEGF